MRDPRPLVEMGSRGKRAAQLERSRPIAELREPSPGSWILKRISSKEIEASLGRSAP
jgi:hypothetical protein